MMRITRTIEIDAPADQVWDLLGPQFADVASWARLVTTSSRTPSGDGRQCTVTGVPGATRLVERLTSYDDVGQSLAYVVDEGMPAFVRNAANRWSVESTGHRSSQVTASATFSLAPWALVLGPVLRLSMARIESRTLADLKAAAETRVASGTG